MYMWKIYLFLVLCCCCIWVANADVNEGKDGPFKMIIADVPLESQSISFEMEEVCYVLPDLKPSAFYEVRVSYPATMPAVFHLHFEGEIAMNGHRRRLLNIEKISFQTDSNGNIPVSLLQSVAQNRHSHFSNLKDNTRNAIPIIVCVRAEREGISPDTHMQEYSVKYDIVLETLIFTNIPFGALKIVLLIGAWASVVILLGRNQKFRQWLLKSVWSTKQED